MALSNQIHLYSLDTSCFYTADEMKIYNRLMKLYSIRKRLKDKIKKINNLLIKEEKENGDKISYLSSRIKFLKNCKSRTSALISVNKERLIQQFQFFKSTNQIRQLRPETLYDRHIQSMFVSTTSRVAGLTTNDLTTDIMIVQTYYFEIAEDLIINGFIYNGDKYILLTASAGQIRTKKFVMIKESLFNSIENTLTCGLTRDKINKQGGVNTNKYLAYLALNNSATELWEDFDIDRAIVVEDFETEIDAEVDYIDDATYEIERKMMKVPIPHMDGCGIMLNHTTRMLRAPWIKGLMVTMPFDTFVKEHGLSGDVTDIYGKKYNIFTDNIQYILTKSQFKMWKYYKDWDSYKENFKKYNCQVSYCNEEIPSPPNAKLNYQMIQTLTGMTDKEIQKICARTIKDITDIGQDFRTMNRLMGVDKDAKLYKQQALYYYPEMYRDKFTRQKLKEVKAKLVKEAKAGKLAIDGKYTFVIPDVHAFCEWLFMGKDIPEGLLKNGEVFCQLYPDGIDLDCLRSPHLYREHAVRRNIVDKEKKKWFVSNGIYTSTFDPISKLLQFDNDGDVLLVVKDKRFVSIAKKHMKGIVPLYYEMKKAAAEELNNYTLYKGLDKSYRSGKIGLWSNDITKIWNSGEIDEEKLNLIKLLCMENNFVIDEAKTLYKPTRPQHLATTIKRYTNRKVPYFFIYAKDKDPEQVEKINNSTVNRICKIIPDKKITYNKTIGKFDYQMLMNRDYLDFNATSEDCYGEFRKIYKNIMLNSNFDDCENKNEKDIWAHISIKTECIQFCNAHDIPIPLFINIIISKLYNTQAFGAEKALWAAFGRQIVKNIINNTAQLGNICPICGARFNSKTTNNQMYCSDGCYEIINREKTRLRMANIRKG